MFHRHATSASSQLAGEALTSLLGHEKPSPSQVAVKELENAAGRDPGAASHAGAVADLAKPTPKV